MNLSQLLHLENKLIFLQNVNGDRLGIVNARDIVFSPRFNAISSLTFTVDRENCNMYDLITSYRIIELQDIGRFVIENPVNNNDGLNESKTITCRSYEIDINRKTIPLLQGTFKFYSIIPDEKTIMSVIMSYLPNWTIASIDANLWNVYRTFDIADKPLYQFIMEDVATSYECVFIFDTINNTITVKAYENVIKPSDIYLSFNNLIKTLEITEKTEDLLTALTVSGQGLSINLVNPLGSTIYNFKHFTDTVDRKTGLSFMSNDLKNAIANWQTVINNYQNIYANYLTQRKIKIGEMVVLKSALTTLEDELTALITTRDTILEAGQNASAKNAEIIAKQTEIDAKNIEITNKQTEIDGIVANIETIQNTVAIKNYFNSTQLSELEHFIISNSVTDEHFVAGEEDTDDVIQETSQALYDKYKRLLDKNAVLKYEFSIDLVNFITFEEYEIFTSQLDWGIEVTLDNDNGTISYPILLGLEISMDKDFDTQFLFGTDMRFSSAVDDYEEYLANTLTNTSSKVARDSLKWGDYINSGAKDRTDNFFAYGLNLDLMDIKSANGQEIIFDKTGLLGRKLDNGVYSDYQWKFINRNLLFTDDNWNTAKLGIGFITLPDLSKRMGVNAEVIMGQLIAGNSLIIKNANNTFMVDSNGATLTNATLSVIGNNGLNKILLDATNGLKIQKKINDIFTDVIYMDTNTGDANYKGNINASIITGSSLKGGDINIADLFTVNAQGQVDIKSGSINLANNFIVASDGSVSIKKGSLDIASNFIVSSNGDLVSNGNVELLGNIHMGGSITWDTPIVKYEYSVDNISWHTTMTANDKYRREDWGTGWQTGYQFVATNGVDGSDANVPDYITSTCIDFNSVSSPFIRGNEIVVQGGTFTIKDISGVTTYGYMGYGRGNNGNSITNGVLMSIGDYTGLGDGGHYIICTDSGVRMTSGNYSIYCTDSGAYWSDGTTQHEIGSANGGTVIAVFA
jgi:hypothetical protein